MLQVPSPAAGIPLSIIFFGLSVLQSVSSSGEASEVHVDQEEFRQSDEHFHLLSSSGPHSDMHSSHWNNDYNHGKNPDQPQHSIPVLDTPQKFNSERNRRFFADKDAMPTSGVERLKIKQLHRRAPLAEDPRPVSERPADPTQEMLDLQYDELLVEFTVSSRMKIDTIQVYLPERQDCRGKGKSQVCTGYEFMTEPAKTSSEPGGDPGMGGCVFRRREKSKLSKDNSPDSREMDYNKDILSCMVNNRIGDGKDDVPRRSGVEILLKNKIEPKGEKAWYFIIMIQNPKTSPVWPRYDVKKNNANAFIFVTGSRDEKYKSSRTIYPAEDIKPLWECTYSSWVKVKECTARCGGGLRYYSRRMLHSPPDPKDPRYDPLLLVKCEEPLFYHTPCNEFLCDTDCKLGKWVRDFHKDSCSASCGGGFETWRRQILVPPRGQGKSCPPWNSPLRVKYRTCTAPSNVPCKSTCEEKHEEWSYSSDCNDYCGGKGGVRYKFKQVNRKKCDLKAPMHAGMLVDVDVARHAADLKLAKPEAELLEKPTSEEWRLAVIRRVITQSLFVVALKDENDQDTDVELTVSRVSLRPPIKAMFKSCEVCKEEGMAVNGTCHTKAQISCLPSPYDKGIWIPEEQHPYKDMKSGDGCETTFVAETCTENSQPCGMFFVTTASRGNPVPREDSWQEVAVVFKLRNEAKTLELRAPEGYTFGIAGAICMMRKKQCSRFQDRDCVTSNDFDNKRTTLPSTYKCIVTNGGRHAELTMKNALEPTPDPKEGDEWEPKYFFQIWVRHPACEGETTPGSPCKHQGGPWSLGIFTEQPGLWESVEHRGYQLYSKEKGQAGSSLLVTDTGRARASSRTEARLNRADHRMV